MASQCLQLHALRTLLTGGSSSSRKKQKVPTRRNSSVDKVDGWQTRKSGDNLRDAAQSFRDECNAAVRMVCVGSESAAELLVDTACALVERLLVGVAEHLPQVRTSFEIKVDWNKPRADAEQEMVVLEVRFHTDKVLVGEIATRSRIALCVQLKEKMRFALAKPRCDALGVQQLLLFADGWDLPPLPDCVQVRNMLRAELGDGLSPTTAYEWWEEHRHRLFHLRRSKFHRLVESLLEQKALKLLGKSIAVEAFWGYVHTVPLRIKALEFHIDRRLKAGVSVSAQTRQCSTDSEEHHKIAKVTTQKMMLQQRARAEKLAPSGINVGAMICGAEVGHPGACPRVLKKLFTAAKWYSHGDDGSWHNFDETWNCTDRKDIFGRVTEENGRLIWRLQDEEVNAGDDLVQREESNGNHDLVRPSENSRSRNQVYFAYFAMFMFLFLMATSFSNASPLRLRWPEW